MCAGLGDHEAGNRRASSSCEKLRSLDAAATVGERDRGYMQKKRATAEDSIRVVVQGSSISAPSLLQFRELSLVSMPVEAYSSGPWSHCCCSELRSCDGLVVETSRSSTSSSQCCSEHDVVDSNNVARSIACLFEAPTNTGSHQCAGRSVRVIAKDSDFWDCNGDLVIPQTSSTVTDAASWEAARLEMMSPRERIQLFRQQMSGKVVIPETWPGEEKLKEWAPHGVVEDALRPLGLMIARAALMNDSLSKSRLASSRLPVGRPRPA